MLCYAMLCYVTQVCALARSCSKPGAGHGAPSTSAHNPAATLEGSGKAGKWLVSRSDSYYVATYGIQMRWMHYTGLARQSMDRKAQYEAKASGMNHKEVIEKHKRVRRVHISVHIADPTSLHGSLLLP